MSDIDHNKYITSEGTIAPLVLDDPLGDKLGIPEANGSARFSWITVNGKTLLRIQTSGDEAFSLDEVRQIAEWLYCTTTLIAADDLLSEAPVWPSDGSNQ